MLLRLFKDKSYINEQGLKTLEDATDRLDIPHWESKVPLIGEKIRSEGIFYQVKDVINDYDGGNTLVLVEETGTETTYLIEYLQD